MLQLFSKAQNICAYYLVYLACLWCTQNFPPTSLNFSHHKQHLTEVRNQHTNSLKKKLQSRATTCHIWVSRGDSAGQSRRCSSLKGNLSIDARGIKQFRLMRTTLCTKEIAGDMSGLIKTNGWWELYIGEAEHANQDTPQLLTCESESFHSESEILLDCRLKLWAEKGRPTSWHNWNATVHV